MKTCTKCKVPCELGQFRKDSSEPDGLDIHCKSCVSVWEKKWRNRDPERVKQRNRKNYVDHRESRLEYANTYYQENKTAQLKYLLEYRRNRIKTDPQFRIRENLSCRLYNAVRGSGCRKSEKTKELLGCPWVWLEVHLESLFKPGMTWENYGPVWHVDHIRPCASFNLLDPEQQRICFHWTNLQPLFAKENMQKSDKYPLTNSVFSASSV